MSSLSDTLFDGLIRKLSSLTALDAEDLAAIRRLPARLADAKPGMTIAAEGQAVSECCLLVSGYACRHKVADDGGRQIVSFQLAGDLLDVQNLLFGRADHNVQTITPARLAYFPIRSLRDLVAERAKVGQALWRDCLVDASIFREWVLNVGRRDAKRRIVHMVCEFAARAEAAGLGAPTDLTLPMTQEQIADATGLTAVHVNRVLRTLSEEGLLNREARQIRIVDWPRMQRISGFSPLYLHLAA